MFALTAPLGAQTGDQPSHITPFEWRMTCGRGPETCYAQAGPVRAFETAEGAIQFRFENTEPGRVSLLHGRQSRDLPDHTLSPDTPEWSLLEETWLLIEYRQAGTIMVSVAGLRGALLHISQRAPSAPYLQRFKSSQTDHEIPPQVFIPASKPQSQFAVRAQGGQPAPELNGPGRGFSTQIPVKTHSQQQDK